MAIGRILSSEIQTNRDGTRRVRVLQVEVTDPDDIQTVEYMQQSGEDTGPLPGQRVLIDSVGEAYKISTASEDNIEPEVAPGEKKIYSVSDDAIAAFIQLFVSGNIAVDAGSGELNINASRINITGELRNNGVLVGSTHRHGGVEPGSGNSGVPVGG